MIGNDQPSERLSADIREATKNLRRRYTLYYVTQTGGSVDFDELVTRVASWETGRSPEELDVRTEKSVYSSLYQTHLPILEEQELISFDREAKTVSVTDRTSQITIEFQQDISVINRWVAICLLFSSVSFLGLSLWVFGFLSESSLLNVFLGTGGVSTVLVFGNLYAHYQSISRSQETTAPDYTLKYKGRTMK